MSESPCDKPAADRLADETKRRRARTAHYIGILRDDGALVPATRAGYAYGPLLYEDEATAADLGHDVRCAVRVTLTWEA